MILSYQKPGELRRRRIKAEIRWDSSDHPVVELENGEIIDRTRRGYREWMMYSVKRVSRAESVVLDEMGLPY